MPTTKDFKNQKTGASKNANKSHKKSDHKKDEAKKAAGTEAKVVNTSGENSKRRPGREESEPVQETLKFQDAYVTQEPNQEKTAAAAGSAEKVKAESRAPKNEPPAETLVESVEVPIAAASVDAADDHVVEAPFEKHHHRGGSDEDLATLEREAEEPSDAPKIEIRFSGSELLRSRFPTPFALAEVVATDWVFGGEFDKLPINQPLAKFAAQQGLLKAKEIEKRVMESPAVEKAAIQVLTVGMKAQGFISELREKLRKP